MIPVFEPFLGKRELDYAASCVKSSWISSAGRFIGEFESSFASYCGAKYGIATSNGTTALHLALVCAGVGRGDEVIVPDLTFVATANAVTYTGARPVFVDVEEDTFNIDPALIEKKITRRTKAVIPVHLYGHPADMGPILRMARKHGLFVLEDAAEAHGAAFMGRKTGALGDAAAFSFYGNKIITTGEGGMVLTGSRKLAERARLLRDHAMSSRRRYWHGSVGFNYRLTNIQAAIGLAQLEKIDRIIRIKRKNAGLYGRYLSGIPGLRLPVEKPYARSVFWMYSPLVVKKEFGMSRDKLMLGLKEKGIDTRPFFHPLHALPPFAARGSFPVSERVSRQGINLPSSAVLTEKQIMTVAAAIKEINRDTSQFSCKTGTRPRSGKWDVSPIKG